MSRSGLSPILRLALPRERPDRLTQRVISVNGRDHGFFALGGKKKWLVTNELAPEAEASGSISMAVGEFESVDPPLSIRVQYRARCMEGCEQQMAQALARRDQPQETLHARLRFWVEERAAEQANTLNLDALFRSFTQTLQERAARELGIALRLRFETRDRPQAPPPEPLKFDVVPADVDGWRSNVELAFELVLDPEREVLAVRRAHRVGELKGRIEQTARRWLEEHARLHDIHYYAAERLTSGLAVALTPAVREHGLRLHRLRLRCLDSVEEVELTRRLTHDFQTSVREARDSVRIESRILLELYDLGRFRNSGSPALDGWIRERVVQITEQTLLEAEWEQMLLGFEAEKASIRAQMVEAVESIGYRIRQFHTISALQVDVLKDPFIVTAGGRFATQSLRVEAGLEVVLTGRIPKPDRIANLLSRQVDVQGAIQQAVDDALTNVLHSIEPGHFYLEFQTRRATEEQVEPGNPYGPLLNETLEVTVRRVVAATVEARFGAEILQLVLKPSDSELITRIETLRQARPRFQVSVEIKTGRFEDILYEATLVCAGVDPSGWDNFVTLEPTAERVVEELQQAIQSFLAEKHPRQQLNSSFEQIEGLLNQTVVGRVGREYGVAIRLQHLRRLNVRSEALAREESLFAIEERHRATRLKIEATTRRLTDEQAMRDQDRKAMQAELRRINQNLVFHDDLDLDERAELKARRDQIQQQLQQADQDDLSGYDRFLPGPTALQLLEGSTQREEGIFQDLFDEE